MTSLKEAYDKIQDNIRNEMLFLIRTIIVSEMSEELNILICWAYIMALGHFRSVIDIHNEDLLNSLTYQVNKLKFEYLEKRNEIENRI